MFNDPDFRQACADQRWNPKAVTELACAKIAVRLGQPPGRGLKGHVAQLVDAFDCCEDELIAALNNLFPA